MLPPPRGEEKRNDEVCEAHRAGEDHDPAWCTICENEAAMDELKKLTIDGLRKALYLHHYVPFEVAVEMLRRLEEAEAFRLDVIKRCEAMMGITKGE